MRRDYTLDAAGRRARVDYLDGSRWNYAYNDRGEVTGGQKYLPSGAAMPGGNYGYTFDGIGNRTASTDGDAADTSSYTTNNLNQYTQRVSPQQQYLIGAIHDEATVTVNGNAPQRIEGHFYQILDRNNASGPGIASITVDADRAGFTNSRSGFLRSAPATAAPTHDADGNLLNDGLWSYTWNGENRLIAIESVAAVPDLYKVKKEFVYDYMGRRVEEKRYTWNAGSAAWDLERQPGARPMRHGDWRGLCSMRDLRIDAVKPPG